MAPLKDRLNKILPRLKSDELLSNKGLGNEIGFYVFQYNPEDECAVRDHIQFTMKYLEKDMPALKVKHINLFELIIEYLKDRKLLDRALGIQRKKGDGELLKGLRGPLKPEKLAAVFAEKADPENTDLVLLSGVGNSWPMLRSHNLLNNLHAMMGKTPLVMFYPGKYTGYELQLFGKIKGSHYYRAFQLVSE